MPEINPWVALLGSCGGLAIVFYLIIWFTKHAFPAMLKDRADALKTFTDELKIERQMGEKAILDERTSCDRKFERLFDVVEKNQAMVIGAFGQLGDQVAATEKAAMTNSGRLAETLRTAMNAQTYSIEQALEKQTDSLLKVKGDLGK